MPLLVKIFLAADGVVASLYVVNYMIGQPFWFPTQLVDLNKEGNISSWYSSVKLFLVAVMLTAFVYPHFKERKAGRWVLSLVPIVFFALSLDEIASIHEWFGWRTDFLLPSGHRENSLFHKTGIWMFLLGPAFLSLMLLLGWGVRPHLKHRPGVAKKYLIGLIIFVGSAAGTEILSNFVAGTASVVQIVCEEWGEMLGATIWLWATYELLVSSRFSIRFGLAEPTSPKHAARAE